MHSAITVDREEQSPQAAQLGKVIMVRQLWGLVAALVVLFTASDVRAAAVTFGPPFALNTDAATDTQNDGAVQIATDGAGHWVAVWVANKLATMGNTAETDIFVARSSDDGATWTALSPLNTNAATDTGDDRDPALATDRSGNWLVVWSAHNFLGNDPDIVVARSTDNGVTWSDPAPVNSDTATDLNRFDERPWLATDRQGQWVAVWEAYRVSPNTDYDIMVARSADAGVTWTAPAFLNNDFATDTRTDWQARITTDGAGHWVTVWRGDDNLRGPYGQDGDIYVARSSDGGATWSDPAPLNTDAAIDQWTDAEPQVATDGVGHWVAIWNATFGIKVARSTDAGLTWTDPLSIDGASDLFPDLATDASGTWLAVWHTITPGSYYDISVSSSTDNGATWTPAGVISNPIGFNAQPHVATDGAGHWVAVWASDDPLGGSGVDRDILTATGITTTAADACTSTPAVGCWAPDGAGAALLQVSNPTGSSGDSVLWKSKTSVASSPSTGAYSLCLYGGSNARLFSSTAPGGATCDGSSCWRPMGTSGLKYKNRARTPDGVDSILLKGGSDGKLKIVLRAKGANLSNLAPLPMPPLTLPVQLQLQGPSGWCWGASYAGTRVMRNAAGHFVARSE